MSADDWTFNEGNYFFDRDGARYCVAFERINDLCGQWLVTRNGLALWTLGGPLQEALAYVEQHSSDSDLR